MANMALNWDEVLKILKNEVSSAYYKTWYANTFLKSEVDRKLVIAVPTSFIKEQLEKKFLAQIQSAVKVAFGKEFELGFIVESKKLPQTEEDLEMLNFPSFTPTPTHNLNPRLTLENFVVGLSNNLAFAAAQAIVQNPGTSYNPLFIYGGTGVGKTHLMVGIGNALIKRIPSLKVIYCSSEKFMNDFIQSIQNKKTNDFRNKYRSSDLLLVDDVQFISGRDSTQEEFFHTFNELQSKNSQIILTSDRTPEQMHDLESRLRSRFKGGLMVDIQTPDFDTRVAILKAKSQERGEYISEDALTLIAQAMPTNGRELEGKLIQIIQISKLNKEPISIESVKKHLGQPQISVRLDHKKVFNQINNYFNIKMADLLGPRRKKELVLPRHLAMYLLYIECQLPYERIGELLGGRDHTTILHGVDKIREVITRDREVQKMLIEIKQALS